jgi:hypothetical protein
MREMVGERARALRLRLIFKRVSLTFDVFRLRFLGFAFWAALFLGCALTSRPSLLRLSMYTLNDSLEFALVASLLTPHALRVGLESM